jgi:hypothetical protein
MTNKRATQIGLGVSLVIAGLALSGSANADSTPLQRWQNANTTYGAFYLGVSGGEVCTGPNGSCGLARGTGIITYQLSGDDQKMSAPLVDATGTIQDFYADKDNMIISMCVGVGNNSQSLGAGLVIWDCQDQTKGPGQYWTALSAEELGAPFPGCFVFVNQNSSVNGATVVMSVQNGVVANGSPVIQYSLCEPTNNACGNPANAWHADQFWCPVSN